VPLGLPFACVPSGLGICVFALGHAICVCALGSCLLCSCPWACHVDEMASKASNVTTPSVLAFASVQVDSKNEKVWGSWISMERDLGFTERADELEIKLNENRWGKGDKLGIWLNENS